MSNLMMEQSETSVSQQYSMFVASFDHCCIVCGTSRARDKLDTTL